MFMKRWKYFVKGVPLNSLKNKKESEEQLRTVVGKEMTRMSCVCETFERRG